MGSTWRYVSEAHGHLIEVYEQLLDMPQEPPMRMFVGLNPDPERAAAESEAASEWFDRRMAKIFNVVEVLSKHNVTQAISDWREHAIAFLRKTPSARAKQKFHDDDNRVVFLCVVLWYARIAVEWLKEREDEGLLQGGLPYREMTARAATFGASTKAARQSFQEILPEEMAIIDELEDEDPRLAMYCAWTYIDLDLDPY